MYKKYSSFKKELNSNEELELEDWYEVTWDEEFIYQKVSPPDGVPWDNKFKWNSIIRICFNVTDFLYPDELYFFTLNRPESYVIPLEAKGANKLWNLVIKKKLFNAELAIKVAIATNGVYCWPEDREDFWSVINTTSF